MKSILRSIFPLFAVAAVLFSCTKVEKEVIIRHKHVHAFIMMSFGFTDGIGPYLKENISVMEKGPVPDGGNDENLLFLYTHNSGRDGKMTAPELVRVYRNHAGDLVRENVMTFSVTDIPNTGENISKVLECIRDRYQADSYGMLISSHGTGWLPSGYMSAPDRYEGLSVDFWSSAKKAGRRGRYMNAPVPYIPTDDDGPVVKSIGATWTDDTHAKSYETDIMELADAIPFTMEYIIFDACYMGGAEVAYELKDKCRWLCASQTEILGDGMDYVHLLDRLLKDGGPDPEAVCSDFFSLYDSQSGSNRSATVSMVDCSRIDVLAAVCRTIFRNHGIDYDSCDRGALQQFFRNRNRNTQKWFYDLRSIMVAAGADEIELADLDWALEQCVVYKAATERFMNDFDIKTFCGLSMYLPYPERNYLNSYYKELAWNKTTGLLRGE